MEIQGLLCMPGLEVKDALGKGYIVLPGIVCIRCIDIEQLVVELRNFGTLTEAPGTIGTDWGNACFETFIIAVMVGC